MDMSYIRSNFLKLGVLSLTLLVLGCSEEKSEVVTEPAKASAPVTQDHDAQYDAEFKKVGETYASGLLEQDKDKMREALKLISDLIEKEPDNTKFLGQRINIYMSLEESEHALADLKKRNGITKSGTFKFAECMVKDSITKMIDSSSCYKESAEIYAKELKEPEKDSNYLIALLYSGDANAKSKIEARIAATDQEWEKQLLEMTLESYDKYLECKKLDDGPCPIS